MLRSLWFSATRCFLARPTLATVGWAAHYHRAQLPGQLFAGIYVTDINHVPSRVCISGVHIHDKLGRGLVLGGFHMLVQDSSFENLTAAGIATFISGYFHESIGLSDIAIHNNALVGTNYVPKLYQTSVDGTNYYPAKGASIVLAGDLSNL
jgi:hypothetical protein